MMGPQNFGVTCNLKSADIYKHPGKQLPANRRSLIMPQVFGKKAMNCKDSLASDGHVSHENDGSSSLSSVPEQAKRETFRLASFKSYDTKHSPFQLAMAGFYYVGPGDKICCYSCGTFVTSLDGNEDVSSPEFHTSDCKHLLGEDSGNVTLGNTLDTPSISTSVTEVPVAVSESTLYTVNKTSSNQVLSQPHMVNSSNVFVKEPSSAIYAVFVYNQLHRALLDSLNINKEEHRIISFSDDWPERLIGLVNSLAKTGFFFLGNHDRTQCFSCGAVQRNWVPTDDVFAVHAEHFPECRMVRNVEDRNIPLSIVSTPAYGNLETTVISFDIPTLPPAFTPGVSSLLHSASTREVTSVKQSLPVYQLTVSTNASENVPSISGKRPLVKQNPRRFGTNHSILGMASPALSPSLSMRNENLDSFRPPGMLRSTSNLPNQYVPPLQMPSAISAVFNATGSPQSAQQHSWFTPSLDQQLTPVSSHFVEHSVSSPQSITRQRSIPSSNSENLLAELDPFSSFNQPTQPVLPNLPVSELDVDDYLQGSEKQVLQDTYKCLNPVNPSMVYLSMRLSSFRLPYPENNSLSSITVVAEAGFYYLGSSDFVCCWYCGTEAKSWSTKWNAWEMHALLYPSCEYLLRNRGPSFIEAVLVSGSPKTDPPAETSGVSSSRERNSRRGSIASSSSMESSYLYQGNIQSGPERLPSPPPPIVDPRQEKEQNRRELQRSMRSEIVQDAMRMGFERNFIRKVVKRQIKNCSCNYQTLQALLDALLANEPDLIDLDSSDEENEVSSQNSALYLEDLDENVELYHSEETSSAAGPSGIRDREHVSSLNEVEAFSRQELSIHENEPSARESGAASSSERNDPNFRLELQKLRDEKRCKVCLDRDSNMVFVPCGHMCACMECTHMLRQCPICRSKINKAYRTYS